MHEPNDHLSFLKNIALGGFGAEMAPPEFVKYPQHQEPVVENRRSDYYQSRRKFNAQYQGVQLNRIAFPIGGIGTGMFCLESTGAISHISVRHRPEIFHEPSMFAAIAIKGETPL